MLICEDKAVPPTVSECVEVRKQPVELVLPWHRVSGTKLSLSARCQH